MGAASGAREEKGTAVSGSGSPVTPVPAPSPSPDPLPGPRAALVVATGTYIDPGLAPLAAATRDAELMAEVLRDPGVGGFEVTNVIDGGEREIRGRVEEFLADRGQDDVVVVYLSCHGVLDARDRLYFAAADTVQAKLASTGVEAGWLLNRLQDCPAVSQVVILDCCFSGAFVRGGSKGGAGTDVRVGQRLAAGGRGRAVLTASKAMERSWEGDLPGGGSGLSVFTRFLVQGLRTGAADGDGDGLISVDDAYYYAYEEVMASGAGQTPQRYISGGEGTLWLARNPAAPECAPGIQAESLSVPALRPPPDRLAPSLLRGRRKARLALALGAFAAAAATLIAALTAPTGPSGPPRPPEVTSAVFYGFSAPDALAADGSHLWVAGRNSVTELNTPDGSRMRTLSNFSVPSVAVEGSHLWVAGGGGATVTELNTADGSQVRYLVADNYGNPTPAAIAADQAQVWIAEVSSGAVADVNSADGAEAVLSTDRYGFDDPDAIAADGVHVWVANYDGSSVTELNAADGSWVRTLSGGNYRFDLPDAIATDGTDVWVANERGNSVTELNASDGSLIRTLSGPGYGLDGPSGIAVDGADVWVANAAGNSVTELNASDGTPVRTLSSASYHFSKPAAIVVVGAHVWVANEGGNSVTELSA